MHDAEPSRSGCGSRGAPSSATRARELLERVGLADRLDARPARALGRRAAARGRLRGARAPSAAAPCRRADRRARCRDSANAVFALIAELARGHGTTVIVVSHDPRAADRRPHDPHPRRARQRGAPRRRGAGRRRARRLDPRAGGAAPRCGRRARAPRCRSAAARSSSPRSTATATSRRSSRRPPSHSFANGSSTSAA